MHPSWRPQESQFERGMFSYVPDKDFLSDSSRKRKHLSNDQSSHIASSAREHGFPMRSSMQLNAGNLQGKDLRNSVLISQPGGMSGFRHHCDRSGFWDQNNLPASQQPNERRSDEKRAENNANSSFGGKMQFLDHKESSLLFKMPTVQTHGLSNQQPLTRSDVNQRIVYEYSGYKEKSNNSSHGIPFHPSASESGFSDLVSRSAIPACSLDGVVCSQGNHKVEPSSNMKDNGYDCSVFAKDQTSTIGTKIVETSLPLKQYDTGILLQNVLHYLGVASGISVADKSNDCNQSHGSSSVQSNGTCGGQIMGTSHQSDIEHPKNSVLDDTSLKNVEARGNHDGDGFNSKPSDHSSQPDEGCKSAGGGCILAETLWEGNMQLDSSVTVSVVAFFKSGEKMHDINWSKSVEVKGKVKLEAFEKYVQDLPRSRTRRLMVVSLCLKEGSSEDGLKGMKEVARKYKEGKRVGRASLSASVDLYICPRSDTVITILAKYGFLKGMVSVIDDRDSLIGCVVWKKNPSSNHDANNGKEKKNGDSSELQTTSPSQKPLTSPSEQEPVQPASKKHQMTVESVENNSKEKKNADSSELHSYSGGPSNASPCVSVSSIPAQDQMATGRRTSDIQPAILGSSEVENSKTNSNPKVIFASNAPKQPAPTDSDDDDLPEYDFRTSSTTWTSTSKALEMRVGDKEQQLGNNSREIPVSSQRVSSESSTISRPPAQDAHQMHNKLQQFQQARDSSDQVSMSSSSLNAKGKKNLFDDDDMPEWCPPDLDLTKKPFGKTTRLPFSHSTAGHMPPLLPTPRPSTWLRTSDKGFHSSSALRPPLPGNGFMQEVRGSSVGTVSNGAWRHQIDRCAINNPPIPPSPWTGRRDV